jgi:GT2 family glycosyltransferase
VVVTFQSASVIERCLAALARAAPRRGVETWVVDNASTDDSARLAERAVGPGHVVRLPVNRGYAAGVNAGIARATGAWIGVLNPDTEVPPGALDALVDQIESLPRAGLLAPSICDDEGRVEASAGRFPTLERERAHALALDRALGREGRTRPFPPRTAPVDWASGCAWLLRAEAARAVGPLDEEYFMYFEDVDYGRRLWDAGWQVLATPDVRLVHLLGRGSASTSVVPADGGAAAARYLRKFLPAPEADAAVGWLRLGWRVRWAWRSLRGALGDQRSSGLARRYRLALDETARQ